MSAGLLNRSEITRGYPLVIWEYLRCQWKTRENPMYIRELMCRCYCRLTIYGISHPAMFNHKSSRRGCMHCAEQHPPAVTSGWAVAKAVLWRTSYNIFQDPQTKNAWRLWKSRLPVRKQSIMRVANTKKSVLISLFVSIMPTIPIQVLLKPSRGTLAIAVEQVELLP